MRNVIGRENLITCGQTNLPTLYWQNILVQSWKLLYGWQNGARQHYITLPGSTESYGERTPTCMFENHNNLCTYLTNWLLTGGCTLRRMAFEMPGRPFSKLCLKLLFCAYCSNKLPEWGNTKARLRVLSITPLRAWAHRQSAYAQLSPLYLCSTLYVTHVIKKTRPSPAFPYCKRRKAERDLGTRLVYVYYSNCQLTRWVGVNPQVHNIEGQERKINKSNNIIM